jgi:hypothetical protein
MYSDNIPYAKQRLENTIVMYQGEPITILGIDEDAEVTFCYLKNGDGRTAHLDELDLVGQNKLGYVNYGLGSYHVVRKPMRNDWRQGIRMGNLTFSGDEGFHRIPNKEFRDTILGIYPSFATAKKLIKDGYQKVAFSRNFAINSAGQLLYKDRIVGTYDILAKLEGKFNYLTESLNDLLEGNYAYD